ncbi:ribonuclease P/MRP 30kDa subunit [Thecamonas trahens ATCC 50062]|uniref:Ribonuclease P/MRP 30kDa subunit n=1 Tax=Thecamonas trahens ATCC 50062 TaxID=461836 RepID=A0A0L0D9E1_THETB|nr:ribonuclease P/MRP 30kDa subunit [Thecamonas trahens ATCC 50062]KNC48959.1 ribonuclease P/MRP 30kDa subunit [Thecamonas trahens ATCC 50062]|eukprot:XP_013758376.1 ribonuclease P/MRP 30kDa subunit [Thecamonas trahens ATCC 50062]
MAWNTEVRTGLVQSHACDHEEYAANLPTGTGCARVVRGGRNDVVLARDVARFVQVSRLTVVLEKLSDAYPITPTSPVLASYGLVAVVPKTEKLFQQACASLETDIISIDGAERLAFFLKFPTVGQAISRGIHFELSFSPLLTGSPVAVRNLMSNALSLVRYTRGKNILLTSGAREALALRSPYDVTNLGVLFGLSPGGAKLAISSAASDVLAHAESRSMYRTSVGVEVFDASRHGEHVVPTEGAASSASASSSAAAKAKATTAKAAKGKGKGKAQSKGKGKDVQKMEIE